MRTLSCSIADSSHLLRHDLTGVNRRLESDNRITGELHTQIAKHHSHQLPLLPPPTGEPRKLIPFLHPHCNPDGSFFAALECDWPLRLDRLLVTCASES